ncbi:MAG: CHRD domain-containing protein [Gammaproteobacteria bacterium]|nr:CHRD domain-containing protein [Gammaproteobacteria bacterium]
MFWRRLRWLCLLSLSAIGSVQADIAPSGVDAGPVVFFADLSADEQAATTVSKGRGRAEFLLDRLSTRLSWRVTTTALDSTVLGVAIHGPQRMGTNAGVQIDLAPQGARAVLTGSAVLTEAQLDYLLAGRMYVNVRTRRYPVGELRGQIQRQPPTAAQTKIIDAAALAAARANGAARAVQRRKAATPAVTQSRSLSRKPGTLSFVVANWDNAIHETRFMDECPEGPAIGNDELWWRGLSRADKDKLTEKGLVQPVDRRPTAVLRGPEGVDVCWNPTSVQDPPLRTARSKVAFGFNLDGRTDDNATAKTCRHENFTGVNGEPGVDNQMYRLLACHYGWRRNGVLDTFGNEERRNSGRGVVLIEITGITDSRNSSDVKVAFYRALDPFQIDNAGRILPHASYRIDMQGDRPRYGTITSGKIVDGVLHTTAVDLRLPYYANSAYAEIDLRDMRLELDLTPGADGKVRGLVGGYYDLDKWWEYILKVEFLIATGDWSCPALFRAAHELADGYPDPKSGACTAISSAFRMDALPAFVIHPGAGGSGSGGAKVSSR